MSSVFVSHSSKDGAVATEIVALLKARGHHSIFLDFDPEDGIPAGRSWEKELYSQLRACRVVLLLCSPASMESDWCFAEITHARALGKHVLPLKIADCTLRPLLADVQVIDFATNREEGLERLWRGLDAAGLDPAHDFNWDPRRPPYPGLPAFEEDDAAVFFGRDGEIREGLDLLWRQHNFGGSRFILFLGASGSGKSSLLRAGIVPRLRRDASKWLVLGGLRPSDEWTSTLAMLFSDAFSRCGTTVDRNALRDGFAGTSGAARLLEQCRELRFAAGRPAANVVLVLDQLEEAFDSRQQANATALLAVLRIALLAPQSPLLVTATLRSDFFAQFQTYASSENLAYEQMPVGAVPVANFPELIEGPARAAGLELDSGLTTQLVQDTAAEDALPLLAFTLRELWERRSNQRIETMTYRDVLGGLAGSVARAAETVLRVHPPSDAELAALREALIAMVHINDEGRPTRRPARMDALPAPASRLIEYFVQARLFVSRGDGEQRVTDVAHDALFRAWGRLKGWLAEDQAFLLWRKRIEAAYDDWSRGKVLLTGQLLREAESRRGELARLRLELRQFVETSIAVERRRRRIAYAAVIAIVLVIVGLSGFSWWGAIRARRAADVARAAGIVSVARGMTNDDPATASLLLAELDAMDEPSGGVNTARDLLNRFVTRSILAGHKGWLPGDDPAGGVELARFSPDGTRVVTAGGDGTARVFDARKGGEALFVLRGHEGKVLTAEFDMTGKRIVTASEDGTARIWPADGTGEAIVLRHEAQVRTAHFSPDGTRVVTASRDGTARVWNADGHGTSLVLGQVAPSAYLSQAVFSADGQHIVVAAGDGSASVYRADGAGLPAVLARPDDSGFASDAAFDSTAQHVLVVRYEKPARIWNADGTGEPIELVQRGPESGPESLKYEQTVAAAFSPDGDFVATLSNGMVLLWDLPNRPAPPRVLGNGFGGGHSVVFSADGMRLLVTGESDAAVIDVASGKMQTLRGHANWVNTAVFSPDERTILTASADGTARIWVAAGAGEPVELRGHKDWVEHAAFTPDGRRVITASQDRTTRIFSADGGSPTELRGAKEPVFRAEPTRDGSRIVAFDWETIRVWNADGRGDPVVIQSPDCSILAGALSPDGSHVAAACREHTIDVWRTDAHGPPVVLRSHTDTVWKVAFNDDGTRILSVSDDRTARIWRTDGTGRPLVLEGHKAEVIGGDWCANGSRVVTASKDGTARIWASDSGALLSVLEGHKKELTDIDCSPDGQWVVTASQDKTATVWSVATGKKLYVFGEHGTWVNYAHFTRDSKHVVSVGFNGDVRAWPVDGAGESIPLHAGENCNLSGTPDSDESGGRVVSTCGPSAFVSMIDWKGLVERLRARTTQCLSPEQRVRYLGETSAVAGERAGRCQREH